MTLDILFCSHNRLAFTEASFSALVANTNWDKVSRLHIRDDRSTDNTVEYLTNALRDLAVTASIHSDRFGGPVAAMNDALDYCDSEILAKIDNDVIVCPGWLDAMLDVMRQNPKVDALGMEPGFASAVQPANMAHRAKDARWIGGQGLIRTRVFQKRRPVQLDRFFGWTAHQRRYVKAAWIDPDLPVFNLDHLPFEPWLSLTESYVRQGWQRRWDDKYPQEWSNYWDWWQPAREAVA